jgi:hypothetical protein
VPVVECELERDAAGDGAATTAVTAGARTQCSHSMGTGLPHGGSTRSDDDFVLIS